ncbi:small, acid-soluble spore protein, alpha/beta type [Halobacillus sp. B29]|uniref:small, acid-soluble spore protein, alpha/beta type n=1 Tax=Halobacillus sp. B29 TaxID=3457432 RepID=UPI003FCE9AFA
MARKNKILVPEAQKGLDDLKQRLLKSQTPENAKFEVSEEKGIPLNRYDNGNLSTRDAGRIGGPIGGQMVKELVRQAQKELMEKNK